MTNHLLETALTYVHRNWAVLPLHSPTDGGCSCGKKDCTKPGKHPRTPSGLSDASADEHQIRRWWTRWPDANIGILTGAKSGLLVVDLDNGDGKNGEANFDSLARQLGSPVYTLMARTGRGKHLFFRYPTTSVKNSVGKIAAGVDVRADGGYVVAAPSMHSNGARYEWENAGNPLSELPAWLVSKITNRQSDGIKTPAANGPHTPHNAIASEGTRNNTLYKIGCSFRGQLAMEHSEIVKRLLMFNAAKCVPPLDEAEVLCIAESVCKLPPENGSKKSGNRLERNPLYWFKLNTRDFSADQNIQVMTDFQLGWYTRLRVSAWQNGGIIPADRSILWRLAGAKSRKAFDRDSKLVLGEYESVWLGGEEVLMNRKMVAEYVDVLEQWLKVKAAGEANRDRMRAIPSLTSALGDKNTQTVQ